MKYHAVLLVGLLLSACRPELSQPETEGPSRKPSEFVERPSPASREKTLEFDGKTWTYAHSCELISDFVTHADVYHCDSAPDLRLLDCRDHPKFPRCFKRIVAVQRLMEDGAWRNHGRLEIWADDGGLVAHALCFCRNGKMHGTHQAWYSNGQLCVHQEWHDGLEHGLHEGWYPSGEKQYEIEYSHGVQIDGHYWNLDGSEVPLEIGPEDD